MKRVANSGCKGRRIDLNQGLHIMILMEQIVIFARFHRDNYGIALR